MERSSKKPGCGYPAGILTTGLESHGAEQGGRAPLPACQSSRQKSWNGSGKLNVDNLSARRAISSMAQALGRKRVLAGTRTCFKPSQRAIQDEPVVLSAY